MFAEISPTPTNKLSVGNLAKFPARKEAKKTTSSIKSMAETTQVNRSQNVTKQMKQKIFSLVVSGVIICALLLPVRVLGRLQHPEIEAN